MNVRSFGVAAVFLAGCAVGGGASAFVVPKASAQQAAALTRWEYFCVDDVGYAKINGEANKAGAEGWEMVTYDVAHNFGCFRRPKM